MGGELSQEEINALLNNPDGSSGDNAGATSQGGSDSEQALTAEEKDAIGEVANISMGTAATTLFSLVNRKVEISTPVVSMATWDDVVKNYERPCVFIRIAYTVGLDGSNILVLKENDVKIITDLMMGGDGTNTSEELGELHLSAISEAMNQMMGSAATSLSSMLSKPIHRITPFFFQPTSKSLSRKIRQPLLSYLLWKSLRIDFFSAFSIALFTIISTMRFLLRS